MKYVSFGFTTVQKGRRIIIHDSLLQNLGIKEGDSLELFLNTKEKSIVVRKSVSSHSTKVVSSRKKRKVNTE